jgi:hypothetical protein
VSDRPRRRPLIGSAPLGGKRGAVVPGHAGPLRAKASPPCRPTPIFETHARSKTERLAPKPTANRKADGLAPPLS